MSVIDQIIEFFQEPFWMLLWGMVFWFLLLWSIARNKNKRTQFWSNQKDEMIVTLVGGLIFLIFTESVMSGWDWIFDNETPTDFHCFFYLLVGPAIERIYKLKTK